MTQVSKLPCVCPDHSDGPCGHICVYGDMCGNCLADCNYPGRMTPP